jgi:NAD+ kinase
VTEATDRAVLLVVHVKRPGATAAARELGERLISSGLAVRVLDGEADDVGCAGATVVPDDLAAAVGAELVVAFGGDGTLLRAVEYAQPDRTPLLGVNLGHVGFLAEADPISLDDTAAKILAGDYDVDERLALDVRVLRGGAEVVRDWALNDVSVEKDSRGHMVNLILEIDGRPLSRWGCDGLVCATPTGSTAYAFSAGGPVVWPAVQALLLVPISAHALFARPLVVAPESRVAVELLTGAGGAVAFCDGRRTIDVQVHDRLEIRRGELPVRLVRLGNPSFTDRLVTKFHLPVRGWRARSDDDH